MSTELIPRLEDETEKRVTNAALYLAEQVAKRQRDLVEGLRVKALEQSDNEDADPNKDTSKKADSDGQTEKASSHGVYGERGVDVDLEA